MLELRNCDQPAFESTTSESPHLMRPRRRERGDVLATGDGCARHSRAHPAPVGLRGRIAAGGPFEDLGGTIAPARVRSGTRGDQIWREQSRSKASEESADGGDAERGAAAGVSSIARNASGGAKAATHASAERTTIVRWPL